MATRKIKRLVVIVFCSFAACLLLYLVYGKQPSRLPSSLDKIEPAKDDSDKKLTRSVDFEYQYNNEVAVTHGETVQSLDNKEAAQQQQQRRRSLSSSNRVPPSNKTTRPNPNYCLHVFYYMWYANEQDVSGYSHWNHRYLPHWNPSKTNQFPTGAHIPPDDIAASFYPKLGTYSSTSREIMEAHMEQLLQANIGVAVTSWYPAGQTDQIGAPLPDSLMPLLLDVAEQYNIKIAIHIEPYKGRTPLKIRDDLAYIHAKYGHHPALFKMAATRGNSTLLPVVYIYDSYLSPGLEWANIFVKSGPLSIRGSSIDSVVIGLVVKMGHTKSIKIGGFDGFYTYFASDGFSYGSSTRNWPYLSSFAKQAKLIFIPSAGPGYEDTRVRPWNGVNTRNRKNGEYYKNMVTKAMSSASSIVSITSFNEWHEGTQIEPAIPKETSSFKYRNYEPFKPEHYLSLTAELSKPMQCPLQ